MHSLVNLFWLRQVFVFSGLLCLTSDVHSPIGPMRCVVPAQVLSAISTGSSRTVFQPETTRKDPEQAASGPKKRGKEQGPQKKEKTGDSSAKPSSSEKSQENRPQFIRVMTRKNEPQYLQTAIVSYVPKVSSKEESRQAEGKEPPRQPWPKDLRVDLVGVIHIADKSYYEQLNRVLRKYDVVLYELVAPEGTRATPGQTPAHPVSALQQSLTNMLGLAYQLDVIDYYRPNFVHADLSPEQFYQSMQERGESTWAMFLRAFGYEWARSLSRQKSTNDADLFRALFSKDRQLQLKRLFAQELSEDVEGQIRALEGPQGSTLISGRNERVLTVLEDQVKKGAKTIAIFYGAGHMPHFHDRLTQIGLVVEKTRWVNAWDLRASDQPSEEQTPNH